MTSIQTEACRRQQLRGCSRASLTEATTGSPALPGVGAHEKHWASRPFSGWPCSPQRRCRANHVLPRGHPTHGVTRLVRPSSRVGAPERVRGSGAGLVLLLPGECRLLTEPDTQQLEVAGEHPAQVHAHVSAMPGEMPRTDMLRSGPRPRAPQAAWHHTAAGSLLPGVVMWVPTHCGGLTWTFYALPWAAQCPS